jgi:hypothetical protein
LRPSALTILITTPTVCFAACMASARASLAWLGQRAPPDRLFLVIDVPRVFQGDHALQGAVGCIQPPIRPALDQKVVQQSRKYGDDRECPEDTFCTDGCALSHLFTRLENSLMLCCALPLWGLYFDNPIELVLKACQPADGTAQAPDHPHDDEGKTPHQRVK